MRVFVHACHSSCQTSKHKCLCILWPSSLHNIKHNQSLASLTLLLTLLYLLSRCLSHSLSFFVAILSYEAVLIMFHLRSPSLSACVHAILVFQPIPLSPGEIGFLWWGKEKLLTGKLWLSPAFLSLCLFVSTPSFSFHLLVLNTSHCISLNFSPTHSFHVAFLIPLWGNKELLFRASVLCTGTHSCSLNTCFQLLSTSAWTCLCVRACALLAVKDTLRCLNVHW